LLNGGQGLLTDFVYRLWIGGRWVC